MNTAVACQSGEPQILKRVNPESTIPNVIQESVFGCAGIPAFSSALKAHY